MRTPRRVSHEFVELIPDRLEPDTLYVSVSFATVVHLCLCGCGNEVVTPLSPADWQLTFDGEAITLYPSIGNWSFSCRSHYWINNGVVSWARQWTQEEIDAGRAQARSAKARYLGEPVIKQDHNAVLDGVHGPWPRRVWAKIWNWCR